MSTTETKQERWCIHVPGPDDLYPMRSKEDAERAAQEHNDAVVPYLTEKWRQNPHYPRPESITAVVVEWPHEPVTDDEWETMCREAEQP